MDLKDILSISGKPGLYKNIAQSKTGVIVESLTDAKRFQAFASDKISSLGEISVFTQNDDLPLREVFKKMQENLGTEKAPDAKADDKTLLAFFEKVLPDYDRERVYLSHIRKMVSWYNLLIEKGISDFSDPAEEKKEETGEVQDTGTEPEK